MTSKARPGRSRTGRLVKVGLALLAVFLLASGIGARVAVAGSRAAFAVPASAIGRSFTDVSFPSRVDGLRLSGWLFLPNRPNGRSVILVHGWQGNREDVDFVALARQFLARGYAVLMFDLRGSGLSGGANETMGANEPRDLLGAYDFMVGRGYRPRLMTVLGNSMGAATVIEAAPELTRVAALVCDSAFANLSSAMQGGLTSFTDLPGLLAIPAMEFSRAFGVLPDLSPIAIVRSLPARAFLFIHARDDQLLALSNAEGLFAASANPGSRLLVLDGHAHLDTYTHDPTRYLAALFGFIDAQVGWRSQL